MHTPPHPLHIALATPDEARDLAALLADEGDALPGVGGQRRPAEAFAAEWAARTGATSTVAMEVGRFDLPTRPRVPFEVSGAFRVADRRGRAARRRVAPAVRRRHRGRRPRSLIPDAAPRATVGSASGRTTDAPVSMAYASPANGGVTRISGVWTPPELRGHGYASGVVAALSTARLDAGEACMLYTDLANPTSNAIYQAMGYRRVGDSISITFDG